MRIALWNLERGRSSANVRRQEDFLLELDADVTVLTEVPAELSSPSSTLVCSPVERSGPRGPEAWAAVRAEGAVPVVLPSWIQPPFEHMAVAAGIGVGSTSLVVYASVLPWRAAPRQSPELALPGESASEMFVRFVRAQAADMRFLIDERPAASVIWAGDFNQTLDGPNHGGSSAGRELLEKALEQLDLVAWNRGMAHAIDGMCAIDLICGPVTFGVDRVERVPPLHAGVVLSDHAAYVVDLS